MYMISLMVMLMMMMFLKVKVVLHEIFLQDIEQEEEFLAQEMSHVSHKVRVLLLLEK